MRRVAQTERNRGQSQADALHEAALLALGTEAADCAADGDGVPRAAFDCPNKKEQRKACNPLKNATKKRDENRSAATLTCERCRIGVDPTLVKARCLFTAPGVQFPDFATQDVLIHSIFDVGVKVNRKMSFQQKKQFKWCPP